MTINVRVAVPWRNGRLVSIGLNQGRIRNDKSVCRRRSDIWTSNGREVVRERPSVSYLTARVTPAWLRRAPVAVPIDTVNGIAAPDRAVGGTTALICTSPATEPCDAPA